MEEIKRISRDLVAHGAIIDYYQDTMQIPNGHVARWDFIKHKGAAAVVPVDDQGRIIMVRQYRNALERYTLELPAGKLDDPKEEGIACAARELEEETCVKGLPLRQMRTWGEWQRDPRWRIITTSYLALVEGDLKVQAADDAKDAQWLDVDLKRLSTEEKEDQSSVEVWELSLTNKEQGIDVSAKVEITYSGHPLIKEETYHLLESKGIAVDHGCIVTNALLYLKNQLEGK